MLPIRKLQLNEESSTYGKQIYWKRLIFPILLFEMLNTTAFSLELIYVTPPFTDQPPQENVVSKELSNL